MQTMHFNKFYGFVSETQTINIKHLAISNIGYFGIHITTLYTLQSHNGITNV